MFLLIALLVLLACPAASDTYLRQPGISVQHYVFRLSLSDRSDEIGGEATIEMRFLQDGISQVALDLASLDGGKGMTVLDVSDGAGPLRFRHESDRLLLTLTPPAAGERRRFTVRYRGIPRGGLRIGANKFGERTFFSENWPNKARQWLPMIDHPYAKASSEFIVTAPSAYQVVANGRLVEATDLGDGRRLTHWKQAAPIASWLNALGAAQFSSRYFGSVKGIPLSTWVFHQDRDAGISTFETPIREAMEFYADHIGPFPYEKLGNVEAAGLNGGTEHASAIFYGEKAVTGQPATNLVAHEIAHQWFGDAVTEKDWDDVWLSEGFATYFTLLCTEHYRGRDAFVTGLKRSRETVFAMDKKMPATPVIHENLADMSKVLNQLVYQKGGWTLHMLRGQVGDQNFWAGIRTYYARYRDANASTDDFRRIMEEQSGMELGWFFNQWLHRAGSPAIAGEWRYNASAKRAEVDLVQNQAGDVYRLPLEVDIDGRIEKIEFNQRRQRFEFSAEKEPSAVILDPNTWMLMDARFEKRRSGMQP